MGAEGEGGLSCLLGVARVSEANAQLFQMVTLGHRSGSSPHARTAGYGSREGDRREKIMLIFYLPVVSQVIMLVKKSQNPKLNLYIMK